MLPIVPFDTHAAMKMLTAAGASEEIAVAAVDVAQEAAAEHGRELATRADIAEVRADIAAQRDAIRADCAKLVVELAATRADIETVQAGIETVPETTRAGINEVREATRADARTNTVQASMAAESASRRWIVGTGAAMAMVAAGDPATANPCHSSWFEPPSNQRWLEARSQQYTIYYVDQYSADVPLVRNVLDNTESLMRDKYGVSNHGHDVAVYLEPEPTERHISGHIYAQPGLHGTVLA